MEAEQDFYRSILVSIELYSILNYVKQSLFINIPISAGPTWHLIALDHLDFDLLVLNLVVERGEEFEDHLAQGLSGDGLELAD